MTFLRLVGKRGGDTDGRHLVIVTVVVGFGSPCEDGEVVLFVYEVVD